MFEFIAYNIAPVNALPFETKLALLAVGLLLVFVFAALMLVGRVIENRRKIPDGIDIRSLTLKPNRKTDYAEIHTKKLGVGFEKDDQVWVTVKTSKGAIKVRCKLAVKYAEATETTIRLPEDDYERAVSKALFSDDTLQNIRRDPDGQDAPTVDIHVEEVKSNLFDKYWRHADEATKVSFQTAFWLTGASFLLSVMWSFVYDWIRSS